MKNISRGTVEGRYYLAKDNEKIYYEISRGEKSKKTILFLHGLTGNLRAWDVYKEIFLKEGYICITIDIRGHGLSDRPKRCKSYSFELISSDIEGILTKEDIASVILVGHCFGGMAAQDFIHRYPDRVVKVILISTNYRTPSICNIVKGSNMFNNLLKFIADHLPSIFIRGQVDYRQFRGTTDFHWKRTSIDYVYTSIKTVLAISYHMLHFDSSNYLQFITVPTFVIASKNDTIYPLEESSSIAKKVKQARLLELNDNHVAVINQPEIISEILLDWLNSNRSASPICLNDD